MNPYLVIGSGPTGIACAEGLLRHDVPVLMLDGGESLEPDRRRQLQALVTIGIAGWNEERLAFLKKGMQSSASGIPLKLAYGSDFPYRVAQGATPVTLEHANTKPSYAQGGLSTVWGSAVLPYRQHDLAGWPIGVSDLDEGYRKVLEWMPLAARKDDLASFFPLYTDRAAPLPFSRQAQKLLSRLDRKRGLLQRKGLFHGASRLAVRVESRDETEPGCVLCGNCMYGCPHGLIYASDTSLPRLQQNASFSYRSGIVIRRVSESDSLVTAEGVDSAGVPVSITASRVFIATGVLETASLVLRSLGRYGQSVTLKDSQYTLLPVLRRQGTPDVFAERLHTLSQIFIEIFDESISPFGIHLQTYTYNDLFRDAVLASLGPLRKWFPSQSFLGRLLLFQLYLHSDHSSTLRLTLDKNGDSDRLSVVGVPNQETLPRLRRLAKKLGALSPMTDLFPLFPLLQPGEAGRGFHCGGTFPMSAQPSQGESDIYGRLQPYRRVHIADASTFPTIPATTITFTAMANAYRIGAALPSYEQAA